MTKIKIGIVAVLVAVSGFLFWQNRELVEERARQAMTIMQQRAELADRQDRIEELARQRDVAEAVAAREKARAVEIREEARGLRDAIHRLERENKAVRDYLDARMPADLYGVLRAENPDGGTD